MIQWMDKVWVLAMWRAHSHSGVTLEVSIYPLEQESTLKCVSEQGKNSVIKNISCFSLGIPHVECNLPHSIWGYTTIVLDPPYIQCTCTCTCTCAILIFVYSEPPIYRAYWLWIYLFQTRDDRGGERKAVQSCTVSFNSGHTREIKPAVYPTVTLYLPK